jgi:hypothetical protein
LIQVQRFDYDGLLEAILVMFHGDPEMFASLEALVEGGPEIDEYLESWK